VTGACTALFAAFLADTAGDGGDLCVCVRE